MKITEIKQDKLYPSSKYLKIQFQKEFFLKNLNFRPSTKSLYKAHLTGVSLPVYIWYQISKN